MTSDKEITKDILVAAINRGLLDIPAPHDRNSVSAVNQERIALVVKAYKEINQAVKES